MFVDAPRNSASWPLEWILAERPPLVQGFCEAATVHLTAARPGQHASRRPQPDNSAEVRAMADSSDAAPVASQADLATAQREIMDKRGYNFPEFEWLAEKDPAYEKARLEYAGMIYTRENPVLPVKYREIIAAVILAFRGHPTLDRHVRRALREGATMQEVI